MRPGAEPARNRVVIPLVALATGAFVALGGAALRVPEAADAPRARVSLFALGDTGAHPGWPGFAGRQRALGAALAREDARAPADALLLLGDLFYDNGLRKGDVRARVRANVVAPYCRFVELDGPRSDEVAGACDEAARPDAPARPIYAVLGNHDVTTEESRRLLIDAIPAFVPNWRLSAEPVAAATLSPRVSLVLADSNWLRNGGDYAPLRDALRQAPGPWRILAAHHPIGTGSADDPYTENVRRAVREAGVPVQLMLAGHEHNLQVLLQGDLGPWLVVVSGAGSRPERVETRSDARLYSFADLGFVRVDLVGAAAEERLEVTLFGASRWSSLLGFAPERLGRYRIAVEGAVDFEPPRAQLGERLGERG